MFPYLLRTDSGFIYTFTAVWIAGLIIALWLMIRRDNQFRGWDGLLLGGIIALLLGRLQFVWQHGEWFIEHPAERWNMLQGGFGYAGAVIGGFIGLFLWGVVTRNKLRPIFIVLIPTIPILHFTGWLACWFDGCGYGATTFISWFAAPLPDNFGLIAVRYQTQMVGMITALFLGCWLVLQRYFFAQPSPKSAGFWIILALLSAVRATIYLYQGDDFPHIGQIRVDLLLALVIAICSLIVVLGEVIYSKSQSEA